MLCEEDLYILCKFSDGVRWTQKMSIPGGQSYTASKLEGMPIGMGLGIWWLYGCMHVYIYTYIYEGAHGWCDFKE